MPQDPQAPQAPQGQMIDVFSPPDDKNPQGVYGQIPAEHADEAFGKQNFKLAIKDQQGNWKPSIPARVNAKDEFGNFVNPGWISTSDVPQAIKSGEYKLAPSTNRVNGPGMGKAMAEQFGNPTQNIPRALGLPFGGIDLAQTAQDHPILGRIPGVDMVLASIAHAHSKEGQAEFEAAKAAQAQKMQALQQHPFKTLGNEAVEGALATNPAIPIGGSMIKQGIRGAKETVGAFRHINDPEFEYRMAMAGVHLSAAVNPFAAPILEQMAQLRDEADVLRSKGKDKEALDKEQQANWVGITNEAQLTAGAVIGRAAQRPTEPYSPVNESLGSLINNRAGKIDPFQTASSISDVVRNEAAKQGVNVSQFKGRAGAQSGVKLFRDAIDTHGGEIDSIIDPFNPQPADMRPMAKAMRSSITQEMLNNAPTVAKTIGDEADALDKMGTVKEVRDYITRSNKEHDAYYNKGESKQISSEAQVSAQIDASNAARKILQDTVGSRAGIDPAYINKLFNEERDLIEAKNSLIKEYNDASSGQTKAKAPKNLRETVFGVQGKTDLKNIPSSMLSRILGVKPIDSLNYRLQTVFNHLSPYKPFVRPPAPGMSPGTSPNQLALPPGQYPMPPAPEPKGLLPAADPDQLGLENMLQNLKAGKFGPSVIGEGADRSAAQMQALLARRQAEAAARSGQTQAPAPTGTSPQTSNAVVEDLRNALSRGEAPKTQPNPDNPSSVPPVGGGRVEVARPRAEVFASPNVSEGQMSIADAEAAARTPEHHQFVQAGEATGKKYGLPTKSMPAIGNWTDGSEHSVYMGVDRPEGMTQTEFESRVRATAAEMGKRGNQKYVASFVERDGGPDNYHVIEVPAEKPVSEIAKILDRNGIENRTIHTENGKNVISLIDQGGKLSAKVDAAVRQLGVNEYNTYEGKGEFNGADTREDAAKVFDSQIRSEAERSSAQNQQGAGGSNLGGQQTKKVIGNLLEPVPRGVQLTTEAWNRLTPEGKQMWLSGAKRSAIKNQLAEANKEGNRPLNKVEEILKKANKRQSGAEERTSNTSFPMQEMGSSDRNQMIEAIANFGSPEPQGPSGNATKSGRTIPQSPKPTEDIIRNLMRKFSLNYESAKALAQNPVWWK